MSRLFSSSLLCFAVFVALVLPAAAFAQTPAGNSTGAMQGQVGYGAPTPVVPEANPYPVTPYANASEPAGLPPVFQPAMPSGAAQAGAAPQATMQQPVAPMQPQVPGVVPQGVAPQGGAGANATPAAQMPADPCAAYMNSYEIYAVCQDRMKKLQRMRDAKTKRVDGEQAERDARLKARTPAPVVAPAVAPNGQPVAPVAAGAIPNQTVPTKVSETPAVR